MNEKEWQEFEDRLMIRVLEKIELAIRRIPHSAKMQDFLEDTANGIARIIGDHRNGKA